MGETQSAGLDIEAAIPDSEDIERVGRYGFPWSPINYRTYEALEGAIDIHQHTHPDAADRLLTDLEAVAQAKAVGMRALVLKCHVSMTPDRAAAAREAVGGGIEVFGIICLNPAVGGINPEAVKFAIKLGAKGVWMPSMWSAHNVRYIKEMKHKMGDESIAPQFGDQGVDIVDDKGRMKPEMHDILGMAAQADIMVSTGHLSVEGAHLLLDEANKAGVRKLVVHTVNYHTMNYPLKDLEKMVKVNGAFLEFGFSSLPNPIWMPVDMSRLWTLSDICNAIRTVGPEHCILSTDSGQFTTASPIECMRMWGEMMKVRGFSRAETDLMTKTNPAIVLGLDPV